MRVTSPWLLVACALLAGACTPGIEEPVSPPNIILIYADDLGWRDLGVQGSGYYLTPNIDALAARGLRFTDAYANAPNCAPSRASLLTGLPAADHGIYTVNSAARGRSENRRLIPVENNTVLDTSFVTVAERLKDRGYETGFFGKWHLGDGAFSPRDQGFDTAAGWTALGSPPGYSWPYERGAFTLADLRDTGVPGENLTDRLVQESLDFIAGARKPFFLMLSHYAVHTPIQPDSARIGRFDGRPGTGGHDDARYASMLAAVDEGVGRILESLEQSGLAANTFVVFTSDNGGYGPITSMDPLRGSKGMLYEGGIRVPLLIAGPGIQPGQTDMPVVGSDLFQTFQRWADGLSMEVRADDESLFWHFPAYLQGYAGQDRWRTTPASAIRDGHFKLIRFWEDGREELYNLAEDAGESTNLIDVEPEIGRSLARQLDAWLETTGGFIPTEPNPEFRASLTQ